MGNLYFGAVQLGHNMFGIKSMFGTKHLKELSICAEHFDAEHTFGTYYVRLLHFV